MVEIKKLTDEQLANYVRTKDQEAFVEVVWRYQNKLLRYANYIAHDEMKAADIVQNSFIKAYINLNSFNLKKNFSTWLYRIVHNEAINELLKHKNEIPILDKMDFESSENIEDDFCKKETQENIKNCLAKIPFEYSEPLSLYFLEEKSYEEISDILRLPINTVGTRINRAKKLMKNICQKLK